MSSDRLSQNLAYMKQRAEIVLKHCTKVVETNFGGVPNVEPVLIPAGDGKYPSIWTRDCAMNSECGLIDGKTMRKHLAVIASYGQNGDAEWKLANDLVVPPWAVADHVNYNGRPVYFPGTYDDGDNQGDGHFGFYPPHDDNYYFVEFAHTYVRLTGDVGILNESFSGVTLIERLRHAWEGYNIDPATQLCFSQQPHFTVDWGFCDMIRKTGLLLFPSLLRFHAAELLAELCEKLNRADDAAYYKAKASEISGNVAKTFFDDRTGWLFSATAIGRQYDVWGTMYAVYVGALAPDLEQQAVRAIAEAYQDGTCIAAFGYVRQIRRRDDRNGTAWESLGFDVGYPNYQNGGYWASVSGWLFYALAKFDLNLASKCINEYAEHTRQYEHDGAPYEWINADMTRMECRYAGTCTTLPYIGGVRVAELARTVSDSNSMRA